VETEDTPGEVPETSETPAPWGDDFNPERAWNTISHLRGVEKELEPKAKQLDRLLSGEDPDTIQQVLEAYGYEVSDTDDEEPDVVSDDWEDPTAAELKAIKKDLEEQKAWREQQEGAAQVAAFESTVDGLAKADGMVLKPYHKLAIAQEVSSKGRVTDEAIEKAYATLKADIEAERKATIEGYTTSKKAPRRPASGESASEVPDLDSTDDITDYIKSRMTESQ
jgi:hypothetical protein